MELNFTVMAATIFNILLLIAIIFAIVKITKSAKVFFIKNKEMNEKVDTILNKLENK